MRIVVENQRQLRRILQQELSLEEEDLMRLVENMTFSLKKGEIVAFPFEGPSGRAEALQLVPLSVHRQIELDAAEWREKRRRRQYWIDQSHSNKRENI